MIKRLHPQTLSFRGPSRRRDTWPRPSARLCLFEKESSEVQLLSAIPGPESRRLMHRRMKEIPHSLSQMTPLFIREAKGALVTDVDGNVLLDFAGGIGSLNLGHNHPDVIAALEKQLPKHLHTSFHVAMYESYLALAEKLNRIVPVPHPGKTALFNSGAEAVENAVKIARHFTGRPAIVAFEHAFHGRTLLGMSLTSKVRPYKAGFGPFAPEIYRLPHPNLYHRPPGLSEKRYLENCVREMHQFFKVQVDPEQVAAVIVEMQTGEGGFIPMPRDYLHALARFCGEHGILLIDDEVQTGFGRTGKMFACEHYDLSPDLIVMAKSLGGGMPISAVTGPAHIMDSAPCGGIGTTFGGHPLSCAAALAAIGAIEKEHLCKRAGHLGKMFRTRFLKLKQSYPQLGDIRGLGAMIGVEFVKNAATREPAPDLVKRVLKESLNHGLILLSCGVHGNVLRVLMPLVITETQMEEALDILESAIRKTCHETHRPSRSRRHYRPGHRLGLASVLPRS